MRAFLAIPVTEAVKEYIAQLQDFLKNRGVKAKWVRPESCHLTLLFLGDQAADDLTSLRTVLKPRLTNLEPFSLRAGTLGTFGRMPRVLYLGWEEGRAGAFINLTRTVLQAAAESSVKMPGDAGRKKPTPHLTLARFKTSSDAKTLRHIGRKNRDLATWEWECQFPKPAKAAAVIPVDHLVLYKSTLTPQGAIYDVIEKLPY